MLYLVEYKLTHNGHTKKFSEYWRLYEVPTEKVVRSHWIYILEDTSTPDVRDCHAIPAVENVNVKTIVEV